MKRIELIFIMLLIAALNVKAQKNDYLVGDTIIPQQKLEKLDLSDLILTHYSLLAKHGYIFKSSYLKELFSDFNWYSPDSSFSYNKLTKTDRKNLRSIIPIQRSRKNKRIFQLVHPSSNDSVVYYNKVVFRDFFPRQLVSEMDNFVTENYSDDIIVPNFFSLELKDDLEVNYVKEQNKKVDLGKLENFSYWIATYRENHELKSIKHCYNDYISGEKCGVSYYFDKKKLLYVKGETNQPDISYNWHIQYIKDKPAWINLEIKYIEKNKYLSQKFYF